GSDHHCVLVDRYRRTERGIIRGITGGQLLHLSPVLSSTLIALEDIGRANGDIGRVRDTAESSDRYCVGVDRYRRTEKVICRGITGREFLHLSPVLNSTLI